MSYLSCFCIRASGLTAFIPFKKICLMLVSCTARNITLFYKKFLYSVTTGTCNMIMELSLEIMEMHYMIERACNII